LLERIEAMLIESLAGYVTLPGSPYLRAPVLGDNAGPLGAIALAITVSR
jgi:fructokinase